MAAEVKSMDDEDGSLDHFRSLLLTSRMSPAQWMGVFMAVGLCALDGFDVLAITFAAPAIAKTWDIGKSQLGYVFSVGLLGMALGSFFIAPAADRIGRRPLVLVSLAMTVSGTFWTAYAGGLAALVMSRFLTGLGIGAMIAVIMPLAAEYANARRRDLAVSLVGIGFPAGGVIGGFAAAALLPSYGWQSIFILGSACGVVMIAAVWLAMPEPAGYLIARPGPRALERVNAYLRRCGHGPVDALPHAPVERATPVADLFREEMMRVTLSITAIYLLYFLTLFYVQNWLPTLIADLGFAASDAAQASAWLSIGGILGGLFLGWSSTRFGLKNVVLGLVFPASLLVALFGLVPADMTLLRIAAATIGFALQGGTAGIYAVISRSFPVRMRASGTGFAIGIGRLGSVASPIVASALFAAGLGPIGVCVAMAIPALIAALILIWFPVRPADNF